MYLKHQRVAVLSGLYLFYCQVTQHVSGGSRTQHRDTQTVVTATGTGHEFEDVMIKSD